MELEAEVTLLGDEDRKNIEFEGHIYATQCPSSGKAN